jgi:hypothetical protein
VVVRSVTPPAPFYIWLMFKWLMTTSPFFSSSAISFMVACKESCSGGGTLGLRVEIVQNDSLSKNENKS